jgi:hypothetical protein
MRFSEMGLIALCMLISSTAFARCEDHPRILTTEYVISSSLIFYGEVIEKHEESFAPQNGWAIFEVEASWKGDPLNFVKVFNTDSAHGYPFEKGNEYLVFASMDEGKYKSSICSLTCQGTECVTVLKVLEE